MTKAEGEIIYVKLLDERNRKAEQIIASAKAEGKWLMGLDSNKALFKELDEEYWSKIQELIKQIDE